MAKIRKAKVNDLDRIVELAKGLLKFHKRFDLYYTPSGDADDAYYKFFKSCIYSPTKSLFVAEKDDEIIGYALAGIHLRPAVFRIRRIGVIYDMYIVKKYRGKGIAELFLIKIYRWFRKLRLKYVELSVHIKNEIGRNAWAKYGYEDFVIRQRKKLK